MAGEPAAGGAGTRRMHRTARARPCKPCPACSSPPPRLCTATWMSPTRRSSSAASATSSCGRVRALCPSTPAAAHAACRALAGAVCQSWRYGKGAARCPVLAAVRVLRAACPRAQIAWPCRTPRRRWPCCSSSRPACPRPWCRPPSTATTSSRAPPRRSPTGEARGGCAAPRPGPARNRHGLALHATALLPLLSTLCGESESWSFLIHHIRWTREAAGRWRLHALARPRPPAHTAATPATHPLNPPPRALPLNAQQLLH